MPSLRPRYTSSSPLCPHAAHPQKCLRRRRRAPGDNAQPSRDRRSDRQGLSCLRGRRLSRAPSPAQRPCPATRPHANTAPHFRVSREGRPLCNRDRSGLRQTRARAALPTGPPAKQAGPMRTGGPCSRALDQPRQRPPMTARSNRSGNRRFWPSRWAARHHRRPASTMSHPRLSLPRAALSRMPVLPILSPRASDRSGGRCRRSLAL